ncbi:MAG: tetratricopeptide repeat protein [Candidatus Thorarchaeota archaeon]
MSSLEETLKEIEEHLLASPNDAAAWNSKGVVLAKLERFGEALRCLNKSTQLDPNVAASHTNRGRVLLALGIDKARDALKSFDKALAINPDEIDALKDMAVAHRALGNGAEELSCLQSIAKKTPDDLHVWLRLGDIQLENARFKGAVKSYKRVLEIDESNVAAYVHQSIGLSMLEKWKESIKSAETATKLAPDDIETWRVLADIYLKTDKHKSAIKALKKAAALDPSDADIENTAGMVEYKSGRPREAMKHFERAIIRHKKFTRAYRNLGFVSMELEEWDKAIQAWESFTSLVRNDPDAFDILATAYARTDDFCSASDAWEKARKLYKKKKDAKESSRVTELGRAARINCSRQKKAFRAQKEHDKATRTFDDRVRTRKKKR